MFVIVVDCYFAGVFAALGTGKVDLFASSFIGCRKMHFKLL